MSDDRPHGSTPEIRLTDRERDAVVDQLGTAMSEGRLDVSEFEQRSRQAYAARVPSELVHVLEGLPVAAQTSTRPAKVPVGTRGNRWFFSLLGDRVQRGNIDLGDRATSISVLGDTTFDLTQVTSDQVNLQIFSLLGDVTLLVRRDTSVVANIIMLLGDRKEDAGPLAADPSLTVGLRVFSVLGDVKIEFVD